MLSRSKARSNVLLIASLATTIAAASLIPASASEISSQLDGLTQSLTKAYRALQPKAAPGKKTLAILPFNCDPHLAKQRVGFAISELLTHHFVSSAQFSVVERSNLNSVLEEQSLQLTGAIDSASAVKVGKLVGAELLVLGSVDRLGGKYQVNARIVDTASGYSLRM